MIPRWTVEEMESVVQSGDPVLVDLRASWCPQCTPQEGVLDRLAPAYADRLLIGSLDVEEHTQVVDEYGITGLPSFLLFVDGHHHATIRGFHTGPQMRRVLVDNGVE